MSVVRTTLSPLDDLFDALREGDERALEQLFTHVYNELHRLARVVRFDEAPATLNTTALVHEAYLRLQPSGGLDVESKRHFLRLAARAMRQVIARQLRHRGAEKRGGHVATISFQDYMVGTEIPIADLITLEDALRTLEDMHERQVRVVECRFYAGLTVKETACALDISTATVKRDWRAARAWLLCYLRVPA